MIGRYVRGVVAAIVVAAALGAAPAFAGNTPCPGADRPNANISVNGNRSEKYDVTSSSGLTAMSPDGSAFIKTFAYLYTTRGAGAYVQDRVSGLVVPAGGTDPSAIKKALEKVPIQIPGVKLSVGSDAIVSRGWSVVVFSCNPLQ